MRQKMLLLCGVVMATAAAGCDSAPPRTEPPPPKVTIARPEVRQVVDADTYNGWLRAAETVDIRSRVRGHLDKIHFVDGDLVKKGQLLFELDPRPFVAEVERSKDQVKIFQAQQVAATKEEARLKELLKKGGASQSQVDAAEAQSKSLEAQIEATKQEVARQSLDLEYSKITAPIAGRIGRSMMSVGNLVNAGGTDPVLATIVSVDPIHLYFDVDERSLQRYARSRGQTTRPASLRELKMLLTFGLETDEGFPHAGTLDFADNRIDSQTGTVVVRGTVPNPAAQFVPGARVRIRVPISQPHPVLLVPDSSILTDQDKRYVLALDEKNIVQRRDVQLGRLLEDGSRVVRAGTAGKGITADDWIITQGIQTARVNYAVDPIRPSTQPAATPTAAAAAGAAQAAGR